MAMSVETLVFTPVGPSSKLDYVLDTIESFTHYLDQAASVLLLINDTGRRDLHELVPVRNNIVIFDAPPKTEVPNRHNTLGNLFANQISALRYASGLFDWKCALRLDDDALIIGPRPDVDALKAFAASDRLGMLGAYRYRGDGTNKEADMAKKGWLLLKRTFVPQSRQQLGASRYLLKLVALSLLKGYRLGHMCTGGAFFMSRPAYDRMSLLIGDDPSFLRTLSLDDDLLFALHCGAGGFKIADFSRPEDVMAINWRGLPMPLTELVRHQKKVVHPVKDVDRPEHEQEVRTFFKQLRRDGSAALG